MFMQMSTGSKERHEGDAFDVDSSPSSSSNATMSGQPSPIHGTAHDVFEEIDRYREDTAIITNVLEKSRAVSRG